MSDAEKQIHRLTQAEANYTPDYNGTDGRCASCRWFDRDWCALVTWEPADIVPTGRCDRHELPPTDEGVTLEVEVNGADVAVSVGSAEAGGNATPSPGPLQRGIDAVKRAFRRDPQFTGLKVAGDHWLVAWTNNFKDRDDEWFSAKAIDDYVYRVDHGLVPLPELWVYHIKGTKIGTASWVGRHGHFVFAAGTFDDTHAAQRAKTHYVKHAGQTSISHGFTFDPLQFKDGVYHQFNTFEISLLPRGAEANRFTALEGVKAMQLSDAKRAELERVFGKEGAEAILADYDKAGKALEEIGAEFKEFTTDPRVGAAETDGVKTAAKNAEAAFAQLFADLIGEHAEVLTMNAAMAKEINTIRTDFETVNERATKAEAAVETLRSEMDLRPRSASQDDETVLSEDNDKGKRVLKDVERQTTETHEFWGTEVSALEGES